MAGFEGALANIPGLAGYLASRQQTEQAQSQDLHQLGALAQLQASLQQQRQSAALAPLQMEELQQKVAAAKQKQAMDVALNASLANASSLSPDQLDQLAARAAVTGHPGAVGFAKLAEQKRAQVNNATAVKAMQSAPGQAAIPEQAPATPVDDNGNPNPVVAGSPEVPAKPGVASFLLDSPYVGGAAKSLQAMIDRGSGLTPEQIQKHVDNLNAKHVAETGKVERQAAGQANRIEIRNLFPPAAKGAAGSAEPSLPQDALDQAAGRYLMDGTLPPNMGRGAQGTANTTAILARAAAMAKEKGMDGEAARINQINNKAIGTALSALERQRANVMTYEKTALGGADIAVEMSDKVARDTNVPILDKWIQSGRKAVGGDPDVTRLHNAVETFTNEYAKVMSGSSGGQATTVSMQEHARQMLNGAMTKDQFRKTIDLMKREMTQTRETAFDAQINEMKARMRGGEVPKPAAPSAPAPGAAPNYSKLWGG